MNRAALRSLLRAVREEDDDIITIDDVDGDWLKKANPEGALREVRLGRKVTDDFREKAGKPRLYGPNGEDDEEDARLMAAWGGKAPTPTRLGPGSLRALGRRPRKVRA